MLFDDAPLGLGVLLIDQSINSSAPLRLFLPWKRNHWAHSEHGGECRTAEYRMSKLLNICPQKN